MPYLNVHNIAETLAALEAVKVKPQIQQPTFTGWAIAVLSTACVLFPSAATIWFRLLGGVNVHLASDMLWRARRGTDTALRWFRCTAFVWGVFIGVYKIYEHGWLASEYSYCLWAWWTMVLYFALAASMRPKHAQKESTDAATDAQKGRLSRLEYFTVILWHISIVSTLYVDVVIWASMWPEQWTKAAQHIHPSQNEPYRRMFWSFSSLNIHAMNAVMMYTDTYLNSIPLKGYMLGYPGVWLFMYGPYLMMFYYRKRSWPYPHLDIAKPAGMIGWPATLMAHWLVLCLATVLVKLIRGELSVRKRVSKLLSPVKGGKVALIKSWAGKRS